MIERDPLEIEMLVSAEHRRLELSPHGETPDLDRHTCSVPDFDTFLEDCGNSQSERDVPKKKQS